MHLATSASAEALRSVTNWSMVWMTVAWIKVSLPAGSAATKVQTVPLSVMVSSGSGSAENAMVPLALTGVLTGAPRSAFSHQPKARRSIGTSMAPSSLIAS